MTVGHPIDALHNNHIETNTWEQKMRNLAAYIDRKNKMALMFKQPIMDPNALSETDCQQLLDGVESELSPENLTHDGELPRAEVRKKYVSLQAVGKELVQYAKLRGYSLKISEYSEIQV